MISMIFAIDKNRLIGSNNNLPWHYPEDLAYFKKTTLGHTVLMGQNTFLSILSSLGKPLPGRKSVVVSKTPFSYPDIVILDDLVTYLKGEHDEEIFVIGGKSVFEQSLPYAQKLYITHINKEYEGNVYFEGLDLSLFDLIQSNKSGDLVFAIYERKQEK
ncbi:MAG TPA: dihydrofolate reductase [Bacillota bacterium]|nr:dihydrofolate reductase [Bacillota bacterium]HPF42153.1 dihydrofolate reductase [Bacillota bacterium]HPJ85657.1 dihydrofolate reductase [Bacillota bacterium]HPQ61706.1 dihydrofolate reductase [Bacillota bacterium]HRX92353.1 dihydrofolate reductase [Candidatus Izemoplasmatales bacterium]